MADDGQINLTSPRTFLDFLRKEIQVNDFSRTFETLIRHESLLVECHQSEHFCAELVTLSTILAKKCTKSCVYLIGHNIVLSRSRDGNVKYAHLFATLVGTWPSAIGLGLSKVMFLMSILHFAVVDSIELSDQITGTTININQDRLIIDSEIQSSILSEYTERYPLTPLLIFENQLVKVLSEIEKYRDFSPNHDYCAGIQGNNVDNIREIIQITIQRDLNNVMIDHLEHYSPKRFKVSLRTDYRTKVVSCYYSYSAFNVQRMLSLNVHRIAPYYNHDLGEFHGFQFKNLKENGNTCGNRGRFRKKTATSIIKMQEPGLETCIRLCDSNNELFLNNQEIKGLLLTNKTSKIRKCEAYSFSVVDMSCHLYSEFHPDDLKDLDKSYSKDYFAYLSLTAGKNCKPVYDLNEAMIKIGGLEKLVDARKLCIFENFQIEKKINKRCMNLYTNLKFPFNTLLFNAQNYLKDYKNRNKIQKKQKRNIISSGFSKIIGILTKAAQKKGTSILKDLIVSNLSPKTMLNKLAKTFHSNGLKQKLVSKKSKFESENLNLTISDFVKFQNLSLDQNIYNLNNYIFNMEQKQANLQTRFDFLSDSAIPFKAETKYFLNDSQEYLFSSYTSDHIGGPVLIRHFIKSSSTDQYNGHFLSVIPLKDTNFFKANLWQQGLLSEESKPNICLIAIMQNKAQSVIEDSCKSSLTNQTQIEQDVFIMPHNFGLTTGWIVVINKVTIMQSFCKLNSILEKSKGFMVILMGQDCSLQLNSQIKIKAKKEQIGIKSIVVLNRNASMIQNPVSEDLFIITPSNVISWSFIFMILSIMFIYLTCIYCKSKKSGSHTCRENENGNMDILLRPLNSIDANESSAPMAIY